MVNVPVEPVVVIELVPADKLTGLPVIRQDAPLVAYPDRPAVSVTVKLPNVVTVIVFKPLTSVIGEPVATPEPFASVEPARVVAVVVTVFAPFDNEIGEPVAVPPNPLVKVFPVVTGMDVFTKPEHINEKFDPGSNGALSDVVIYTPLPTITGIEVAGVLPVVYWKVLF